MCLQICGNSSQRLGCLDLIEDRLGEGPSTDSRSRWVRHSHKLAFTALTAAGLSGLTLVGTAAPSAAEAQNGSCVDEGDGDGWGVNPATNDGCLIPGYSAADLCRDDHDGDARGFNPALNEACDLPAGQNADAVEESPTEAPSDQTPSNETDGNETDSDETDGNETDSDGTGSDGIGGSEISHDENVDGPNDHDRGDPSSHSPVTIDDQVFGPCESHGTHASLNAAGDCIVCHEQSGPYGESWECFEADRPNDDQQLLLPKEPAEPKPDVGFGNVETPPEPADIRADADNDRVWDGDGYTSPMAGIDGKPFCHPHLTKNLNACDLVLKAHYFGESGIQRPTALADEADDSNTVMSVADFSGSADQKESGKLKLPNDTVNTNGLVGLSVEEASLVAEFRGLYIRVVEEDGKPYIMTLDYRPNRVNVEVIDGQVVAVRYIA